jgi:hypothetical protein
MVRLFRSRATISDEADGLHISFPPRREWAVLFLVVWLAFWTYAGMKAARVLIYRLDSTSILWMIAWAFGELWASFSILDNFGGTEDILLNSEALKRSRKIFGLGWTRTYLIRKIGNLRFQRGLSRQPSRISFDYGARTISFGAYIEEAEACELINKIRQRCALADSSEKQGFEGGFGQP